MRRILTLDRRHFGMLRPLDGGGSHFSVGDVRLARWYTRSAPPWSYRQLTEYASNERASILTRNRSA